jgi:hypothetical protein
LSLLVALLLGRRRHDGGYEFLVDLQSVGEMLCDQGWNLAGCQKFAERLVAVADITVSETPDKLGPTHPECASAV